MTPTLVFTIVIADILQERFQLPEELFGGLILFALSYTLASGFLTRLFSSSATADINPSPAPDVH